MRPKKLLVSVAVPPAPVRVPSQRPLAPSFASVTSVANDKEYAYNQSYTRTSAVLSDMGQTEKERGESHEWALMFMLPV